MSASTARALSVVAFALLAAIIQSPPTLLLAQAPTPYEAQSSRQTYRYGQFDLPRERATASPIVPRGDITGTYTVYDTQLTQSEYLAAGDLENDGYNDVVSSSYYDGMIAILHQSPQTHLLQLVARWDVTVGGIVDGVADVCIEDMNSDGLKDIVAFDVSNKLVAIFLQTRQYGVFTRSQVDVGFYYNRGGVGDLDNDGRADLLWTNENKVYVAYQTGSGFAPAVAFAAPVPPQGIMAEPIVGDVNGDGLADLVAVDRYLNSMFVWESPMLQLRTFSAPGNVAADVALGDLDGDGVQDLVVPGKGTPNVVVTWGRDWTTTPLTGISNSWDAAVGDIDGDTKSELVVTESEVSRLLIWKFTGRNATLRILNSNITPGRVLISDLNGDGLEDIAYGLAGYTSPPHTPVTVHYQVLPPVKRYLPFIQRSP